MSYPNIHLWSSSFHWIRALLSQDDNILLKKMLQLKFFSEYVTSIMANRELGAQRMYSGQFWVEAGIVEDGFITWKGHRLDSWVQCNSYSFLPPVKCSMMISGGLTRPSSPWFHEQKKPRWWLSWSGRRAQGGSMEAKIMRFWGLKAKGKRWLASMRLIKIFIGEEKGS